MMTLHTADRFRRREDAISNREEELRAHIEWLRDHRSREIVCGLDMELTTGPQRSLEALARASGEADKSDRGVSMNTVRAWWKGTATPTWDAIVALIKGLHPEGRLSDPIEWLQEGQAHLARLVSRYEDMVAERLKGEVEAATRSALEGRVTAAAVRDYLTGLPTSTRDAIIDELIADWLAQRRTTKEEP